VTAYPEALELDELELEGVFDPVGATSRRAAHAFFRCAADRSAKVVAHHSFTASEDLKAWSTTVR
jgi:hypothetical protein